MSKNKRNKKNDAGAVTSQVDTTESAEQIETLNLIDAVGNEMIALSDDEETAGADGDTEEVPNEPEAIQDAPTPGTKARKIKDVMFDCLVTEQITDTQVVLDRIYAEFPEANSGPKDVSWYRWKFREAGYQIAGGRQKKLTEAEKKAKKEAYEKTRKEKLNHDKEARRQEAQARMLEAQQAEIAALTDQAMQLCEERGLPINGDNIRTILAELRETAVA